VKHVYCAAADKNLVRQLFIIYYFVRVSGKQSLGSVDKVS